MRKLFAFLPLCFIYSSIVLASIPDTTNTPIVTAYYTNWSIYARGYKPEQVPYQDLDIILYAFATLNSQNHVVSSDAWADYNTNNTLDKIITQAHNQSKQVLLSIGGYNGSSALTAFMNVPEAQWPKLRDGFIDSLWNNTDDSADTQHGMMNHGFDGIDIDWEPNNNFWSELNADKTYALPDSAIVHFYDLLSHLRADKRMNNKLLTIALTIDPNDVKRIASVNCAQNNCLQDIANTVDYINLMAYDYDVVHGVASNISLFSSPLYIDEDAPNTTVPFKDGSNLLVGQMNVDAGVQTYLGENIAPTKLVLGVPAYVRMRTSDKLYDFTGSTPQGQWDDPTHPEKYTGIVDYKCALSGLDYKGQPLVTYGTQETACTNKYIPLRFDVLGIYNHSEQLVGVDGFNFTQTAPLFASIEVYTPALDTLTPKINYVQSKGLGGMMMWDLSTDLNPIDFPVSYTQYSLLHQMHKKPPTK